MKSNSNQNIEKMLRRNYNDKDSGLVFLFALIVPVLVSLVLSMIISSMTENKPEIVTSSIWYTIALTVVSFLITIIIFIAYNKSNKIAFSASRPNFKMKWHTYLIIVAVGLISLFGVQYFIGVVDQALQSMGYPIEQGLSTINPTDAGTYLLSILLLAIMPAIGEELLFRGVILHGLRSRFNDWISILLSAVMFALMHANLQQLVYPLILGTIMGWIVLRTGSLISSIIVHFINNFLVVTFSFIQNVTGFSLALGSAWWTYLVTFGLLALTFAVCFIIDKFYFKHKSKEEGEKTSTSTSKFIYISLAVAVFLFLFVTVTNFVK